MSGKVQRAYSSHRVTVRYGGYGTVGTVGTVRWVRYAVRGVRWVRYGGYGGYGTGGTVGTVRGVRYGGYGGYGTGVTVGIRYGWINATGWMLGMVWWVWARHGEGCGRVLVNSLLTFKGFILGPFCQRHPKTIFTLRTPVKANIVIVIRLYC